MAVLDLKNNGVKDIKLAYNDRLWLNFIDAGYFCCSKKYRDDFTPALPNDHCRKGKIGPYTPKKPDHDTLYSFDISGPCDQQSAEGSHVIHTGSRL